MFKQRSPTHSHLVAISDINRLKRSLKTPGTPNAAFRVPIMGILFLNSYRNKCLNENRSTLSIFVIGILLIQLPILLAFSGFRWGPLYHVVDEEVESCHLKFLAAPPGTVKLGIIS